MPQAPARSGFLVVVLALACVGVANPGWAQANVSVKVASAGIASDIGFFLAHKKGYFRAEGLDVSLTTLPNSPQMIGPLGMGQLDVGPGRWRQASTMRLPKT